MNAGHPTSHSVSCSNPEKLTTNLISASSGTANHRLFISVPLGWPVTMNDPKLPPTSAPPLPLRLATREKLFTHYKTPTTFDQMAGSGNDRSISISYLAIGSFKLVQHRSPGEQISESWNHSEQLTLQSHPDRFSRYLPQALRNSFPFTKAWNLIPLPSKRLKERFKGAIVHRAYFHSNIQYTLVLV